MTRARELSKLINASSFSVDSDFNVGVNSTSPDVKLDVGGAVLVTGISTFENTTQSTSSTTGALIVSGGVGIAKSLNVGGNLSVAGTITYDDVTNIDSVGIVTAQSGINIVGGGLTVTGVSTFFSNAEVPSDSNKILLGAEKEMQVFHDGTDSLVKDTRNSGTVKIQADNFTVIDKDASETMLSATVDGAVTLRHNGNTKFETTGAGVTITGVCTATSFEGSGANLTNLPASGDSNDITACLFI